ncbi:hypothetical protein [Rhodococcus erythropolis]|uniref:hypothetical protein n=1 Tax=Rhodococcus erythropolis TaxID=1833 RepID=UPI001BE59377|nr:hypothetical protein [Rhodococcus erythropolis]MBT2268796.1 hypothetical protein [Rhodococcus erythropolis]
MEIHTFSLHLPADLTAEEILDEGREHAEREIAREGVTGVGLKGFRFCGQTDSYDPDVRKCSFQYQSE